MEKNGEKDLNSNMKIEIALPKTTSADLRGHQSVRATFKLSEQAINALSIVSVHLGIKQKSLFDHLVEDVESLAYIARELASQKFERENPVQKTFVLSRHTLTCLEQAASEHNTPRDALVEYSIKRLLPVIAREREKHRKRKQLLGDISAFTQQGETVLEKSAAFLGDDDPVTERLHAVVNALKQVNKFIEDYVRKGDIIEDF
jgi:hypothetical protein